MTYNVFGGMLNLAQAMPFLSFFPSFPFVSLTFLSFLSLPIWGAWLSIFENIESRFGVIRPHMGRLKFWPLYSKYLSPNRFHNNWIDFFSNFSTPVRLNFILELFQKSASSLICREDAVAGCWMVACLMPDWGNYLLFCVLFCQTV